MAPASRLRVLLLGGTSEAFELAARLAGSVDVISSLAGRVSQPRLPAGMVRVGGFGGVEGLIAYLVEEHIELVLDATHPFASRISRNAELACAALNKPLIAYERPAWEPREGDSWRMIPDVQAAARLVDDENNRVFLSIGRQELGAFSGCDEAWFLVRSIEAPDESLPARSKLLLQRGPFSLNDELRLLREESINLVVSKNSGGRATYSKIEAARALRIPVIMIERPHRHTVATVSQLESVVLKVEELI